MIRQERIYLKGTQNITCKTIQPTLDLPGPLIPFIGRFLGLRDNEICDVSKISDCLKKSWTFDNVSKELKGLNVRYINPKHQVMDQRAFQFATIGHYIKGK